MSFYPNASQISLLGANTVIWIQHLPNELFILNDLIFINKKVYFKMIFLFVRIEKTESFQVIERHAT